MDLIFKHRSGGELWQGDALDAMRTLAGNPGKIRVIGLFAKGLSIREPRPGYELIRLGFGDNPAATRDEILEIRPLIDQASDRFVECLSDGVTVLSTCRMGLNRSGLVSALTLMKLGIGPGAAIAAVRKARGMWSLSNPAFVRLIHDLASNPGPGN